MKLLLVELWFLLLAFFPTRLSLWKKWERQGGRGGTAGAKPREAKSISNELLKLDWISWKHSTDSPLKRWRSRVGQPSPPQPLCRPHADKCGPKSYRTHNAREELRKTFHFIHRICTLGLSMQISIENSVQKKTKQDCSRKHRRRKLQQEDIQKASESCVTWHQREQERSMNSKWQQTQTQKKSSWLLPNWFAFRHIKRATVWIWLGLGIKERRYKRNG